MKSIEHPFMRLNLVAFMESLSDYDYQYSAWVKHIFPNNIRWDSFDMSVHFLFDDTELSVDAIGLIGYFLYDVTEAESVSNVCKAIEILFDKYGTNLDDNDYIHKPEWSQVLSTAQDALVLLQSNNQKAIEMNLPNNPLNMSYDSE